MQVHIQHTEFYQSRIKILGSQSCDDADQEVTCKGIQYEDENVLDMCRYAIKTLEGSSEGLRSGRLIEVKDAVCFING